MVHAVATAIPLPVEQIVEICRRNGVAVLAVFGSILEGDFDPGGDVGFLARFDHDDPGPWMGRLANVQRELEQLLGRSVDVVDWSGIERSRNLYRRRVILDGHQLLYTA